MILGGPGVATGSNGHSGGIAGQGGLVVIVGRQPVEGAIVIIAGGLIKLGLLRGAAPIG